MDYKYDYGIIDAQYILFRNKSVQLYYSNKLDSKRLLLSVIQSFMKLKRDWEFKYPILVWDRSPYLKTQVLKDYKGDRYKPTIAEIDELRAEAELPETTEERKKEIESRIEEIRTDMENFQLIQNVKYGIINGFSDFGFKSLLVQGYEADDLAYLTGIYLESIGKRGILLTADTDWVNFTNSKVCFYSTKNYSDYPQLVEARSKVLSQVKDLKPYWYGILSEIYWGGHNNTPEYPHQIPFEEFCDKILHGDSTLPDYEERRAYFDAMNVENHWSELESAIKAIVADDKIKYRAMYDYCIDTSLSVNFSTYNNYIDGYEQV